MTLTPPQPAEREDAFTLVELLVVIIILAILAAIAVPVFLNQRDAASESSLKNDVRNAGTLLEGQGKFEGSLPEDLQLSDGVTMTAMRLSDRDNKVTSSQFVDGNSSRWATFIHGTNKATKVNTQVITKPSDGYQGMNYRRSTVTEGGYNQQVGQYVYVDLPEDAKNGDQYTVGVAMRHNYTGSRNLIIEYKGTPSGSGGQAWPGGIHYKKVDFTAGQWQYVTFTATVKQDATNPQPVKTVVMSLYGGMNTGQTLDATGAVVVKGNKIDPAAALSTSGYDFCVQGYHESDPDNFWRYSSLNGGLDNSKC